MSCCTTVDPATGEVTHNYTGNVTIELTSASNGGAGCVAPACNDPPLASVTEQLPAFTIHASVSGSPVAAPELSWSGAPAMLAVGVISVLMLQARRSVVSRRAGEHRLDSSHTPKSAECPRVVYLAGGALHRPQRAASDGEIAASASVGH
jgi:hypothetical protein